MRELGISSDTVANLLNHNTSLLQRTYDKSINLSSKKEALVSYEAYLNGAITSVVLKVKSLQGIVSEDFSLPDITSKDLHTGVAGLILDRAL